MELFNEAVEIITRLNELFWEKSGEDEIAPFELVVHSSDLFCIAFWEVHVWDSDSDGREYVTDDEQESLLSYVLRRTEEIQKLMSFDFSKAASSEG